jgi:hypothetical protein
LDVSHARKADRRAQMKYRLEISAIAAVYRAPCRCCEPSLPLSLS